MRCHICDRVLKNPVFNKDHDEYEPCETCMEVINDLVKGFLDKPFADEDDINEGELDAIILWYDSNIDKGDTS